MEVNADRKGNLTLKSFFKSKEGVSQRAMLLGEFSTLTSVTDGATLFHMQSYHNSLIIQNSSQK